jgi:hypothetical protein
MSSGIHRTWYGDATFLVAAIDNQGEPMVFVGSIRSTYEFKQPADNRWTEGGVAVAESANGKAGFVATTYAKGADATPTLGKLARALKLSECEWSNPVDAAIGKDDVPAKVADGVCLQEGKGVYVMYATVQGDELNAFVLGGWDEDATGRPRCRPQCL